MIIKTINNGHDTFYAVAIMHGNKTFINLAPEVDTLLQAERAYYAAMSGVKTLGDIMEVTHTDYTSTARKAYEDALMRGKAIYAALYGED